MTYYGLRVESIHGGHSTIISRNKENLEKEADNLRNDEEVETVSDIQKKDGNWISVNSEYEPTEVFGVAGDESRNFYYYVTKAKDCHTFISTNKEELKDGIKETRNTYGSEVEIVKEVTKLESGRFVTVGTEYDTVVR